MGKKLVAIQKISFFFVVFYQNEINEILDQMAYKIYYYVIYVQAICPAYMSPYCQETKFSAFSACLLSSCYIVKNPAVLADYQINLYCTVNWYSVGSVKIALRHLFMII